MKRGSNDHMYNPSQTFTGYSVYVNQRNALLAISMEEGTYCQILLSKSPASAIMQVSPGSTIVSESSASAFATTTDR